MIVVMQIHFICIVDIKYGSIEREEFGNKYAF